MSIVKYTEYPLNDKDKKCSNIAEIYTWKEATKAVYDLFTEKVTQKMAEDISLFIFHLYIKVSDAFKSPSDKAGFMLYVKYKSSKGIFYLSCSDFFHLPLIENETNIVFPYNEQVNFNFNLSKAGIQWT